MLDVFAIEAYDFFKVNDAAATAHLPEARDPRLRSEAPKVMGLVILEIRLEERPRAHKRHVTQQHVPDLRELVETPSPEETADASDAGIVWNLEQPRIA